jgi:hypothetical protein
MHSHTNRRPECKCIFIRKVVKCHHLSLTFCVWASYLQPSLFTPSPGWCLRWWWGQFLIVRQWVLFYLLEQIMFIHMGISKKSQRIADYCMQARDELHLREYHGQD